MVVLPTKSISARLAWGFGGVLLLLIAVAAVGQWSSKTLQQGMEDITGVYASKTQLANAMLASVNALGIQSRSVVMLDAIDNARSLEQSKQMQSTLKRYQEQEKELADLVQTGNASDEELQLLKEIVSVSRTTSPQILEAVQQALDGDAVAANMTLMVRVNPGEVAWNDQLSRMVALQYTRSQEATQQARHAQAQALIAGGLLVAFALALGTLIAWRITRSITQPIGRAVVVAERIAAGDLTSKVEVRIDDETGRLLEAIATMQDKLRLLVGHISQTARRIEASSTEVAVSTLDLSRRTEVASNHLESAASTLESLNATLEQSSVSAQSADSMAAQAAGTATRSGAVVKEIVQRMDDIHTSAHKITDIISVIDGIAFQTNILALNAAVEAARAGEQGRGFAVVASEVRSLAGRSATAAKEIKALIDDSTSQVSAGTTLVAQAGEIIHDMEVAVQRVSSLMGDISASTQDQSERIAGVSQSARELENTLQQNSAMVEENAAAAEALKEQAHALIQIVSSFRLER
nr:methyl-accepting chemotaxis protein [uncultured Rhodoferax sp.]